MTDEHGQDPEHLPDHNAEHGSVEESAAQDVEGGVWSDDQPPHDDFGGSAEGFASVSQEAVAEVEGDEAAPEIRQSRSMLPILAGVGGIIVLGGLIYWQFGHSASPPMTVAQKPPSIPSAPPAQIPPPLPGQTTDINGLYKPPAAPATAPAAIPAPTPPAVTPTQAANGAAPTTAMSPPAAEMPPQVPAPSAAITGSAHRVSPPPPGGQVPDVMVANDPADAARINALASRVDDLQRTIDQQNKQLSQMNNVLAAQVPATLVPTAPNPEVENRLGKIEKALTKLANDEASKPAMPVMTAVTDEPSSEVVVPKSRPAKRTTHSVHKKARTFRHKSTPSRSTTHAAPDVSSAWVLRAATPREAWVANDATTRDLRHVQIGETLPGIGVVRSIQQTSRGWEVVGSAGVVR